MTHPTSQHARGQSPTLKTLCPYAPPPVRRRIRALIKAIGLKGRQAQLLAAIAGHAGTDGDGWCFPGMSRLASLMGCLPSVARAARSILICAGHLKRETRDGRTGYTIPQWSEVWDDTPIPEPKIHSSSGARRTRDSVTHELANSKSPALRAADTAPQQAPAPVMPALPASTPLVRAKVAVLTDTGVSESDAEQIVFRHPEVLLYDLEHLAGICQHRMKQGLIRRPGGWWEDRLQRRQQDHQTDAAVSVPPPRPTAPPTPTLSPEERRREAIRRAIADNQRNRERIYGLGYGVHVSPR